MKQTAVSGGLFLKNLYFANRRFAASGNAEVIVVRYAVRMKHGGMAKLWKVTGGVSHVVCDTGAERNRRKDQGAVS